MFFFIDFSYKQGGVGYSYPVFTARHSRTGGNLEA